uniref:Peptidase S1 domain-containing protein n=1 Tax=Strongyloides venezuelensis TaxID=75913 RepID=A0A0K0FB59_STRVS
MFLECNELVNQTGKKFYKPEFVVKNDICIEESKNALNTSTLYKKTLGDQLERGGFHVEIWSRSHIDEMYLCPGVLIGLKHVLTTLLCVGDVTYANDFRKSGKFKYQNTQNLFINFNLTKKNEDTFDGKFGRISHDVFQFRNPIKNIILPVEKNKIKLRNLKTFVLLELQNVIPSSIHYPCIANTSDDYDKYKVSSSPNKVATTEHFYIYGAGDQYYRDGTNLWRRYKPRKREKMIFYEFSSAFDCIYAVGFNLTADNNECLIISQKKISDYDIGAGCYRAYHLNGSSENEIKTELYGVIVSVSTFDPLNDYPGHNVVVIKKVSKRNILFKNINYIDNL